MNNLCKSYLGIKCNCHECIDEKWEGNKMEEYIERDPVTGEINKANPLNKKNLTDWELDQLMIGEDYNPF